MIYAKTAMANGAVYVPATHWRHEPHHEKAHRDVISACSTTYSIALNPDYRTVLTYATQTVTATIVNAKADYLIKNMRRLFKDNGLEGIELQWWGGATTFKETYSAEDSMTLQDCLDEEPGSAEKAVAAYVDEAADGTECYLTTTDDENESEDEEQETEDMGGKTSGGGAYVPFFFPCRL